MTVAPKPTAPTPNPTALPDPQQVLRPDLRLVPPPAVPPETDTEITGPILVVDAAASEARSDAGRGEQAGQLAGEQSAVTPQAPLDVRFLNGLGEFLAARPRWSQRPPSTAEAFEYSASGDWTAEEKSAKRVFHGLCVLLAFVLTYPIDWAVQAARQKPIGFVLTLAVLFLLGKVF